MDTIRIITENLTEIQVEKFFSNCMINLMAMHNQRFFSYLSLFTFFMLVLVTGDNYLIMFIGL